MMSESGNRKSFYPYKNRIIKKSFETLHVIRMILHVVIIVINYRTFRIFILHFDIIFLQADRSYLACRGQKLTIVRKIW